MQNLRFGEPKILSLKIDLTFYGSFLRLSVVCEMLFGKLVNICVSACFIFSTSLLFKKNLVIDMKVACPDTLTTSLARLPSGLLFVYFGWAVVLTLEIYFSLSLNDRTSNIQHVLVSMWTRQFLQNPTFRSPY